MSAEKDFFLENLSLLLRSSMPVSEALSTLQGEIRSKSMKKSVAAIEEDIEGGSRVSTALEKSKLLSPRFVSLLKIGEEAGQLPEQLSLIVATMKKEKSFRNQVRSALIYPAFVLAISIVVGIALVWYVFPQLAVVFSVNGQQLPVTTRAIIATGNFFSAHGILAVPTGIAVLASLSYFLFFYSKTKFIGETILVHTPIAKTIVQEIELARFGYGLGTLLHAGVTLPQALESLRDASSFTIYKWFYASVLQSVMEGGSFYKSITDYPHYATYIPPHIARLLLAGEKSGTLSDTLLRISEEYDQKAGDLAKNLSALLEPIIILFVGLVVGLVAIGVIEPIYGLVTQIH